MAAKDRRLLVYAGLMIVGILVLLVFSSHLAHRRIASDRRIALLRDSNVQVQESDGNLRDGILLQALIDALNHPQGVEEIYHGFSAKQRNEVSYEVFAEYLDLLRTYQQGQVQGLSPLPQRAVETYQDKMLIESLPDEGSIAKYYYLDELTVPDNERLTIRILSKDNEAVLDGQFMQATLDLYQHAGLYFAALSETNLEALTQLVYSDINEPGLKRRKAQETLAFYQNYGFDTSLKPVALEISADYLHFRMTSTSFLEDVDRVPGEAPTRAQHDLIFRRTEDGIMVKDLIPMPEITDLRYIKTREQLDSGRQRYELNELDSSELAGQILLNPELKTFGMDYDAIELQTKYPEDDPQIYYLQSLDQDKLRIVLSYPSAQARNEDRQAKLIYFSLREDSQTWDFEANVDLFMSRTEVLNLYPFLDVYDYRAGLSEDLGLRMLFDARDKLQRIEFIAPEWLTLSNLLDQAKGTAFFR